MLGSWHMSVILLLEQLIMILKEKELVASCFQISREEKKKKVQLKKKGNNNKNTQLFAVFLSAKILINILFRIWEDRKASIWFLGLVWCFLFFFSDLPYFYCNTSCECISGVSLHREHQAAIGN